MKLSILWINHNRIHLWSANLRNMNKQNYVFCCFRVLNKFSLTNPFPTPFADEITRHECYSFTNIFFGYNQVPNSMEDQHKTTFSYDFRSFTYKVIPFGLKNAPTIFLRIVIKAFQEYIDNMMAIYFNDWTIYSLLHDHIQSL